MSQTQSPHMETVHMDDLGDGESHASLKSEIRHVHHENELLRTQLHLVRENAGLRIGSLLATIISWFEEREKAGSSRENLRMYLRKHNIDLGGDATVYVSEQPPPVERSQAEVTEPAAWSFPASGAVSAEIRRLVSGSDTHESTTRPTSGVNREEAPGQQSPERLLSGSERGSASDRKSGSFPQVQPGQPSHPHTSLPARLDSPAVRDANGAVPDARESTTFDTEPVQRVTQTPSAVPEPRSSAPTPSDRNDAPYEEMVSSRLDSDHERPPVFQTTSRPPSRSFHPEDRRSEQAPTSTNGVPVPLGKLKEATFHFTADSAGIAPNPAYASTIDYKAKLKRTPRPADGPMGTPTATSTPKDQVQPTSQQRPASRQEIAPAYDAGYQEPATDGRPRRTSAAGRAQRSAEPASSIGSAREGSQSPIIERRFGVRSTNTPGRRRFSRSEDVPGVTAGGPSSVPILFRPTQRLIGEIVYQLDRRILNYIFNPEGTHKRRFYGYILQNIPVKIEHDSIDTRTGLVNYNRRAALQYRYDTLLSVLRPLDYRINYHPDLACNLVNEYGLLSTVSNLENLCHDSKSVFDELLRKVTPADQLKDVLILLDCLTLLAKEDGKPMIMW